MYFSDLSFTYVGNAAANLFPVSEFNRMHYTNINSLGDIVHCALCEVYFTCMAFRTSLYSALFPRRSVTVILRDLLLFL